MNRNFDFVAVGDNCIDRFQDGSGLDLVGGNALNVAAQLSMLGHKVAYFGAVGDDEDGHTSLRALEGVGVCTDHVRFVDAVTAYSLIRHDETGDRDIYFEEFGASRIYVPTIEEISVMREAQHVHIGWLRDESMLVGQLKDTQTTVSRDLSVNARPEDLDPKGLDIAVLSADSPDDAEGKAVDLIRSGAKIALVTMGAHGSLVSDGSEIMRLEAKPIVAVDTTGAGDAFIAGFLSEFKRDGDIERSLQIARNIATKACLHKGGFPQ